MSSSVPNLSNSAGESGAEPLTAQPDAPEAGSRFPWRVAIALFLGAALWIGPYIGSLSVVMPALVAQIDPAGKVALVGVMGIGGAILSLVSNIIFGALSDVTRSRFGSRAPWILVGAVGTAVGLFGLSTSTNAAALLTWWFIYMTMLNAIVAPMVAVISDRVGARHRGTVSALYGVGFIVGSTIATIAGASFLSNPPLGLRVFAAATLASGVLFVIIAPDRSNKDAALGRLTAHQLLQSFALPRRGARDFYLALFGKFALIAGLYAITNFQLYILTDYIKLDEGGAAGIITLGGLITLATGLIVGFGAGRLSDRLGRRKPFIVASALLIGIGAIVPLVAPVAGAMVIFIVLSAIGNGGYTSVDQALNIEVLPNKENAAKDLGLLNIANSGGQILGPAATSVLVGITGGYQATFLFTVVLAIVSAALIVPIRRVR